RSLSGDARVVQAEARHRLRQGRGVRVFSRPDALKAWFESEGISLAGRKHLLSDAGTLVPGFSKVADGIEFFVHSPFATRLHGNLVERNECSLLLQATFLAGGRETHLLLSADTTHDVWTDMVRTTKAHGNEARLGWDIFKLPHHCSYLSLGPEKGREVTE